MNMWERTEQEEEQEKVEKEGKGDEVAGNQGGGKTGVESRNGKEGTVEQPREWKQRVNRKTWDAK